MIETGAQNTNAFHLAGIVPVAGQELEFKFPWHDSLMPLSVDYLAVERAVCECAAAGCETIWIVCHKDMQPLIRHRLGEWVYDPASLGQGPYPAERKRRVPIFYVPIHPKDRYKRDCLGWSVLYGALSAYHISRKMSKWVIPDKYYTAFPYGVYPIESVREHRTKISSKEKFYLTHAGESVKLGKYLGFTFDGEDFKRCRQIVREKGSVLLGDDGKRLPLHERYSARFFPLDVVFEGLDLTTANSAQVDWYHQIDDWQGYKTYIGSNDVNEMTRPDWLEYHEWNPIGQDDEDD
tara:strand:+ start:9928 stop:10806 length:879 start_codon:yes stop_codon:yes gene_type:complete